MKPWFYNEQSITEFKEPVVYKGLNISVSKTKVKPPYIAVVTSPATSKEVTRTGGDTEQEALDSAKQAIDKREADAPKISASGQTSVLLNVPSNDELLKDPTMYNNIYAKIDKDQNGPTLVIGNEVYGAADLEADGFVRSYDRRMKKNRDSEDALPQIMFNASNKLLSQIGIKMNGRYTLDIEGKYRDDNEHTVYPLQFQSSTIHAGDKERMKRPGLTIGMKREDVEPWFQREFEEAEIIKFPEPVKNVVELPNVQSYPDFLTGVKDLHNRLEKGEISQASHDKLYQDLIHRFMKKESFETPWFIREAPNDATGIMSLIQKRLNDPNIDSETLEKVLFALEGGGLTKRLQNVLENDPDAKRILEKVTETILGAKGSTKEIDAFINQYPKGMVNTDALTSSGAKSWSDIFVGYDGNNFMSRVVDRLYSLKNQGIGPGEVCLSVLSPQIYHSGSRPGAGDIFIEGKGHYEIKASVAKPGRLFDGRKAKVDMNTIQNIRDQLKIEKPRVNIKDLMAAKPNQQQVTSLANAIFRHVDNVAGFVNAVMKNDEPQAKIEHTKLAFTNYQNMTRKGEDTFVGIIFMSGGKKWSNVVSNVDELVQNLAVGTIYVASPDQADLFPQTTYKF